MSRGFSKRVRFQARDLTDILVDDGLSLTTIPKALIVSTTTNTEDDLTYDVKGLVIGGTLDALVERLTRHDMMDSTFNSTFLLTFKSFTTEDELFTKLKGRYYLSSHFGAYRSFNIEPPAGLTDTELDLWQEKVQLPIRLRVLNTIKSWMNNFYTGSPIDLILSVIKEWAMADLRQAHPSVNTLGLINCVLGQQTQTQATHRFVTMRQQNATPPVLPKILAKDGKGLKLLDVPPVEIARQITLQQMGLYMKIQMIECLGKSWSEVNASPDNNID
jgi:son of sevenless-like protein